MAFTKEIDAIRGTSNIYGEVDTGRAVGVLSTNDGHVTYEFHLTGQLLSDEIILDVVIPANTIVNKAWIQVEEAFDLAASSVVEVGTDGSEATNGVSLLEADLESTGYVDVTSQLAGTWDSNAPLAANTTVGIDFSAGSVSDATAGKARLVLECYKVL